MCVSVLSVGDINNNNWCYIQHYKQHNRITFITPYPCNINYSKYFRLNIQKS